MRETSLLIRKVAKILNALDKKQAVSSEEKLLWPDFINDKEELEDYMLCEQCKNDCKQSFRIIGIRCPKYK